MKTRDARPEKKPDKGAAKQSFASDDKAPMENFSQAARAVMHASPDQVRALEKKERARRKQKR